MLVFNTLLIFKASNAILLIQTAMTNLKPIALILCTLFIATNANLIEETCMQTPNHDLCVQYLQADPHSSDADVSGLALIMVNVIKTKAKNALVKIHQLLQGSPEPGQKEALNTCGGQYNAILVADVPQAIASLQKGDPKFAVDSANDAAIEATSCENNFSGKSPLTNDNNSMHDVAAVTSAIVKLLL
ncbi:putative pectinesterase inhibitor domain, Cell wall/vacuolar inhibitor of fructosidase [Lupinus albus]|uniref:Putative pectinesterase inhibitor domain, Cell wall/vacuolar inhibitor of fructosidase n=1 Tax=Lupinus albus TaxID=3870 RepID=A0A6A4Q9I1_LUPAL|nr:putative pectinesterase inhibitor domain, Cell wall/vacuolar inhibitor of fructosidase [Lupinus albus]